MTKVFVLGIGGSGMSSLAHLMLDKGWQVDGYDRKINSAATSLEKRGVTLYSQSEGIHPEGYDYWVYSSAIRVDSHPVAKIFDPSKGMHRSDLLQLLFSDIRSVAVAGSHGKTTTTAMIGYLLSTLGGNPSVMVGGEVPFLDRRGGRFGTGEWGVLEADESDGTFLKYSSEIKVITNVDDDHLDHYKTKENLFQSFADFASSGKTVVLDAEDDGIRNFLKEINKECKVISIGMDQGSCTYKISGKELLFWEAGLEYNVQTPFPGEHYLKDALLAILACHEIGYPLLELCKAIRNYPGVGRRLEKLGQWDGIPVYDDYGHHPTEIAAVISSVRSLTQGRVCIVFQPHRYSRTRQLYREFAKSLEQADMVFLLPIYSAGEDNPAEVSSDWIRREMNQASVMVLQGDREMDVEKIRSEIRPGDVLVALGAGDVRSWGELFVSQSG